LDKQGKPLMPCSEKRARLLLARGRARVCRVAPFVIRLVDRTREDCDVQPVRVSLDPGSRTTGLALTLERDRAAPEGGAPGRARRRAFRRRRRGQLRYRAPRFLNRTRPKGWLPPSLRH
jgi:hypothetical protein